jgi:AAA domain, putative AbiEii toxin, Type IV TA system
MTSRLTEFHIEGLFGLYSHRIPLNLKERITIIIGPNGRGKTVCLKFIEAFFRKNYAYLAEIPYRLATFSFTGGEQITVETAEGIGKRPGDAAAAQSVCLTLRVPGKDPISWTPAITDSSLSRELRRHIPPQWQQISLGVWVDRTDGEELSISELARRYPLPPRLMSALSQDLPDEMAEVIDKIDCHLIETQRLLVLPTASAEWEEEGMYYRPHGRRLRGSRLAIQQKAEKLKTILKDTLSSYANLSQSLDRSFPLRVFEAQGSAKLSEDQLRQELRQLDERRQALMDAGILDTEHMAVTLRGGNIEPGVAMALEIYVKDAVQKLDVLNSLRARLDLFKDLIEKRFIDKTLQIDRESGFKIISKTREEVPLDKLSSGEQHQLILIFDLLFEVKEDSLILIDEPELSLHVAWQKTFIESLSRIIALNGMDVLLATHSPALVARHFRLAVELGPVDE